MGSLHVRSGGGRTRQRLRLEGRHERGGGGRLADMLRLSGLAEELLDLSTRTELTGVHFDDLKPQLGRRRVDKRRLAAPRGARDEGGASRSTLVHLFFTLIVFLCLLPLLALLLLLLGLGPGGGCAPVLPAFQPALQ